MRRIVGGYIRVAEGSSLGLGGTLFRLLLIPFSWLYAGAVGIRHWLFDHDYIKRYRPGAPVISIGNITWGGTAKTSLVLRLAEYFLQRKKKVAVVSRGYSADEPALLQRYFSGAVGVFQGKDRVGIVKRIESAYSPVILDDGFQYRYLVPKLSIVLINAAIPLRGYLLPAGVYRDRLSELRRADIILFTATDMVDRDRLQALHDQVRHYNPAAPLFNAWYQPEGIHTRQGEIMPVDRLRTISLGMLASIAFPAGLRRKIRQAGLTVAQEYIYPDHYRFSSKDIQALAVRARQAGVSYLVTSEKDSMRLPQEMPIPVLTLRVKLMIESEERFLNEVERRCFC